MHSSTLRRRRNTNPGKQRTGEGVVGKTKRASKSPTSSDTRNDSIRSQLDNPHTLTADDLSALTLRLYDRDSDGQFTSTRYTPGIEGTSSPEEWAELRERFRQEVSTRTIVASRLLRDHQPTGDLSITLTRYNISPLEFAIQRTAQSKQAMRDYIASRGPTGQSDVRLLQSLIAAKELQKSGSNDSAFGLLHTVGSPPALNEATKSALAALLNLNPDEIQKALRDYNINKDEIYAIRAYSDAGTNQLLQSQFGDARKGWQIMAQALEKLPSTGALGLVHAGFRVPRQSEGQQIEALTQGTQVVHGYFPMEHGQKHYMSTATAFNVHTSAPRIAMTGGMIEIIGTSGKYINPFGKQASSTDGAEVLYLPGTLSTYVETNNRDGVPIHRFTEVPLGATMNTAAVEDGNYTKVANPYAPAPPPTPAPNPGGPKLKKE